MELTIFGVNVLLLILAWRLMLRKTILDHTRDKLFDLRDEVREEFVRNEWDMNSPIYKKLRDLLNGHLRFTEEFSIWKITFIEGEIKKNPEALAELHSRVQKTFATENPAQQKFVTSIRSRALTAMMSYAVFSSGFLLLVSILVSPFVIMVETARTVGRGLGFALKTFVRSIHHSGRTASKIMSASAAKISDRLFQADVFESYSYRMGST